MPRDDNIGKVFELLNNSPAGLTKEELKSHFPGKNFPKIVKPMVDRQQIFFDGNIFTINSGYISSRVNREEHSEGETPRREITIPAHYRTHVENNIIKPVYHKEYGQITGIDGYKIVGFTPKTIDGESALKFFVYTYNFYKNLIVKHLNDRFINPSITGDRMKLYLSPTDGLLLNHDNSLEESGFILKEFIFHSQNKTNGIGYFKNDNETKFEEYLCHYNLNDFYDYISNKTVEQEVATIGNKFGCGETQAKNLFNTFKAVACYLKEKNNAVTEGVTLHNLVKSDFEDLMPNYLNIYHAFIRKIPYGFKEALTFDFLKEFDRVFDLPKPDLHVKRTMSALYHNNDSTRMIFYNRPSKLSPETISTLFGNNSGMRLYLDLMSAANNYLNANYRNARSIPNYYLDKMIYLICSGMLYLQKDGNEDIQDTVFKNSYLKGILNDNYLNTDISADVISEMFASLF